MGFAWRQALPVALTLGVVVTAADCSAPPVSHRAGPGWIASYTSDYTPPGSYNGYGAGSGHAGQMTAIVPLAADDVLAAGYTFRDPGLSYATDPVMLRWDGSSWSTWDHQPDGGTGGFEITDMAASADDDVWLKGTVANTRAPFEQIRHWDGHTWSTVTGRGLPYEWSGDVMLIDSTAWLVGHDIEHGGAFIASYQAATTSRPAKWVAGDYARSGGFISGFVTSDDDAWAVGSTGESDSPKSSPLVAHWSHGRWRIVATPDLAGGLFAVAATGRGDVLAVGADAKTKRQSAIAMRYDGQRWRAIPVPPTAERLQAVAPAPDGYWAAGADSSDDSHSVYYPLDTDGTWTTTQGPERKFASAEDLFEVNEIAQVPGAATQWGVGFHYSDGCMTDSCVDDNAGALTIDESP